jgi:hypothetical protein
LATFFACPVSDVDAMMIDFEVNTTKIIKISI